MESDAAVGVDTARVFRETEQGDQTLRWSVGQVLVEAGDRGRGAQRLVDGAEIVWGRGSAATVVGGSGLNGGSGRVVPGEDDCVDRVCWAPFVEAGEDDDVVRCR